ncbi:transposon Ty3-G Gag-Pol polyprotein [Elysia marginata]|uniref:Transposon Ty3-G Gag-Pol polyprotein n=1 Tax=Elysia marginata TaxID=1093978 RepID=A0AAV4H484_9GAST|nr:transposon Ty3-G Gag-Pol polyprotein [Elysia marginata]
MGRQIALLILKHQRQAFSLDGVVLHNHRLVIPSSLHHQVVTLAHDSHQGIVKTKQLIREKVWFPSIDKMVEEHLKGCVPCQSSVTGTAKREPLRMTSLPEEIGGNIGRLCRTVSYWRFAYHDG